jgi:HlyD family secretion protein
MVDIPRETKNKTLKRILYGSATLVALVLITYGLSTLERAAPTVDRATLWLDTVKRGELLLERRGPGTLVPEEIRAITARTAGRVEELVLLPGAYVQPDTVILRLSDPDVELAARNAEWDLQTGEANYRDLEVRLETQRLQQQAQAAQVQAEYSIQSLTAERDQQLYDEELISELQLRLSLTRAEQAKTRHEIEQERLRIIDISIQEQLGVQRTQVDQLRARYELAMADVAALEVRADIPGVLQEMEMEVGESVVPGQVLARVVQPENLKAELRIPEVQAKDIRVGQPAVVDTRTAKIPGIVTRIDPAAQQGTVTVDVKLLLDQMPGGKLPEGARPQLSVDGTVEITRLPDVLYVGKPAFGQSNSTVGLFKVIDDGEYAVRTNVQLGLGSVNLIEVIQGLEEGDEVILSDMSRWDSVDRVRLR